MLISACLAQTLLVIISSVDGELLLTLAAFFRQSVLPFVLLFLTPPLASPHLDPPLSKLRIEEKKFRRPVLGTFPSPACGVRPSSPITPCSAARDEQPR